VSTIQNIPEKMIKEHVAWHTKPGNPGAGGRTINPWPGGNPAPSLGSGEEFLVWHRGYIQRFRDWMAALPEDQKPLGTEAWEQIPIGLKMGMLGWSAQRAQEERRLNDPMSFSSLDEVGLYLEWSLHGWLHSATSNMWNEPILMSFESPRSTYFWQLHGLIDHWRNSWVER